MRRQKSKAKKTRHPIMKNMDDVEAAVKDKIAALIATKTEDVLSERKKKLAALGKEPVDQICAGAVENADALDDIYHSSSWQEMQVKIALYGMILNTIDHAWLCNTLAYHYGFWPHTRPRFKAYCQLVAKDIDCMTIVGSSRFVSFVKKEFEWLDAERKIDPTCDIPGRRDEIVAWKKLHDVVTRCKKRLKAIQKTRKKKQCSKTLQKYSRKSLMSLSSEQMGCLGEMLSSVFKKLA